MVWRLLSYVKIEKQFNRTRISINDLDQTIKYLECLNRITSHEDDIIRSALLIAAIISYSRPFSENRSDKLSVGIQKFGQDEKKEIKNEIGEETFAYHKKILGLRNKAVAHSEYATNPTKRSKNYSNKKGFVITSRFFNVLSLNDFDPIIFQKLAECVKKILVNKLYDLNKILCSEDQ